MAKIWADEDERKRHFAQKCRAYKGYVVECRICKKPTAFENWSVELTCCMSCAGKARVNNEQALEA